MDLELTGRRAVITGGSRGIGLATAKSLVGEGCDVALVARDKATLDEAVRQVEAARSDPAVRVIASPADTSTDESVAAMADDVVARLGGVDILVNSAATPNTGAPFSDDDLESEINVKVRGYLRCARAVVPSMLERGWGRIVNISGLAARQTGSVVGSVRNVAVAAMTKNLADELGPKGINVTVVHPGITRTERSAETFPARAASMGVDLPTLESRFAAAVSIGRIVTAEEVAAVITFLASPRSVALNGDPLITSGGARGVIHY